MAKKTENTSTNEAENTNEPQLMSFAEAEEFIAQQDISGFEADEIERTYTYVQMGSVTRKRDGKVMPTLHVMEEGKTFTSKRWLPQILMKKMIKLNSVQPITDGAKLAITRTEKDFVVRRL